MQRKILCCLFTKRCEGDIMKVEMWVLSVLFGVIVVLGIASYIKDNNKPKPPEHALIQDKYIRFYGMNHKAYVIAYEIQSGDYHTLKKEIDSAMFYNVKIGDRYDLSNR